MSSLIEAYIQRLRRKIDDGHPVKLIQTRRGAGYTLTTSDADGAGAHPTDDRPPGSTVRVELDETDSGYAIAVKDQGPGIPIEIRSQIFERFFRADVARPASSNDGAGLGLALAQWIRSMASSPEAASKNSTGAGSGAREGLTMRRIVGESSTMRMRVVPPDGPVVLSAKLRLYRGACVCATAPADEIVTDEPASGRRYG